MEQQRRKVRTAKAETETPYLGAHDLIFAYEGELDKLLSDEIVAEIKEVKTELIEGKSPKGGGTTKKQKKVLYFKENVKPVVVNAIARKFLEKSRGLFAEQWVGLRITLFVKWGEMCFGELMNVLRLKEAPKVAPANLPEITPTHARWAAAKAAILAGTFTINGLKEAYRISPENEKLILAND